MTNNCNLASPPHFSNLKKVQKPRSIEIKLADFDVRDTIKIIISSSDNRAEFTVDNFNKLKKKHPAPTLDLSFPAVHDATTSPLITSSSKF